MTVSASEMAPLAAAGARVRAFAMDGALLGLFMLSASVSVTLVEHPASPLRQALGSELVRRALVGLAMGITAVLLIYSPWGKRSGALMNPAVALAFLRLGKLNARDATGYVVAQLVGGALGMALSSLLLGRAVADPSVRYVITEPGAHGWLGAWTGEFVIAWLMMSVVLGVNRVKRLAPHTGWFAAGLVALFITVEAPLSGMSLNPARTFASALVANSWNGFWIYVTAPVAGMLAGVELRRWTAGDAACCGRLHHDGATRCFLECECFDEKRSLST
jgi:aquaporin Z